MSFPITSWLRAYFALQERAFAARGYVELYPGTDEAVRWPRTTGADVLAISAVIDPAMREAPRTFGSEAIRQRWLLCRAQIGQLALAEPERTFEDNRAFWRTVLGVCSFLDSIAAPVPPQRVWNALLAELTAPRPLRNTGPRGDGPFKHFENVATFHDLYLEQYRYLRESRGSDMLKPEPGMGGPEKPIPRTTNADVIKLADYWSEQLASVKRVINHDAVVKRWRAALDDVDQLARHGQADALYPKNNAFWRALSHTATHVSAADEAPTTWDIAIDSLKDSLEHLPENLKAGAETIVRKAAGLAGELAHGVGTIASQAGRGLFAGLGVPLLLGGGLIAMFLLSERHDQHEETEA